MLATDQEIGNPRNYRSETTYGAVLALPLAQPRRDRGRSLVEAMLQEQAVHVRLDGSRRNPEPRGNLFVREAGRHQGKDLGLSSCDAQTRRRRRGRLGHLEPPW